MNKRGLPEVGQDREESRREKDPAGPRPTEETGGERDRRVAGYGGGRRNETYGQ